MHVPHSMSGRSTRGRASCQTVKKKTLASLGQCDCGYRVQTVRLEGWHSFRMSCGALEHVNMIDLPMLSSITKQVLIEVIHLIPRPTSQFVITS